MKSVLLCLVAGTTLLLAGCHSSTPGNQAEAKPLISKPATPQVVAVDIDFQPLNLEDFTAFQGDEGTWTSDGSMIVCSGVPVGYLYSKEKFQNFTLRGEFQFVLTEEQLQRSEMAETGFLLAIQEPHKIWPNCLKVQGRFDQLGGIVEIGGKSPLPVKDLADVRERVRLPIDLWNAVEIEFRNGMVTTKLNGEVVSTSEKSDLEAGFLGLQSAGNVVRFRNLRVRRGERSSKTDALSSRQHEPAF